MTRIDSQTPPTPTPTPTPTPSPTFPHKSTPAKLPINAQVMTNASSNDEGS